MFLLQKKWVFKTNGTCFSLYSDIYPSRNQNAGVYNYTALPQQGDYIRAYAYIIIQSHDGSTCVSFLVRNELGKNLAWAQYPVNNRRQKLIREKKVTQCIEWIKFTKQYRWKNCSSVIGSRPLSPWQDNILLLCYTRLHLLNWMVCA